MHCAWTTSWSTVNNKAIRIFFFRNIVLHPSPGSKRYGIPGLGGWKQMLENQHFTLCNLMYSLIYTQHTLHFYFNGLSNLLIWHTTRYAWSLLAKLHCQISNNSAACISYLLPIIMYFIFWNMYFAYFQFVFQYFCCLVFTTMCKSVEKKVLIVVLMYVSAQIVMFGCQLIPCTIIVLHDEEQSFKDLFCTIKAGRYDTIVVCKYFKCARLMKTYVGMKLEGFKNGHCTESLCLHCVFAFQNFHQVFSWNTGWIGIPCC